MGCYPSLHVDRKLRRLEDIVLLYLVPIRRKLQRQFSQRPRFQMPGIHLNLLRLLNFLGRGGLQFPEFPQAAFQALSVTMVRFSIRYFSTIGFLELLSIYPVKYVWIR